MHALPKFGDMHRAFEKLVVICVHNLFYVVIY